MKFKNLKLGDEVYVVPQQRSRLSKPSGYYTPITKVGTKYIYIKPGRFHPEDGKSAHKEWNERANGFGFDVYLSKHDYETEMHQIAEYERLKERLMGRWSMVELKPVTVAAIHEALDKYES